MRLQLRDGYAKGMSWMCPLACSAWSCRRTWISLLRKIISTKYVRMMRRLSRLNHRRWFTRIGNGQTEEGRLQCFCSHCPCPTQGYVLSFTWCESIWAAVASTPFSPELQPALFNIGERPNVTTASTFWERAAVSCAIHLVTINGLIHKASWV